VVPFPAFQRLPFDFCFLLSQFLLCLGLLSQFLLLLLFFPEQLETTIRRLDERCRVVEF
jgi:hypothetical protein